MIKRPLIPLTALLGAICLAGLAMLLEAQEDKPARPSAAAGRPELLPVPAAELPAAELTPAKAPAAALPDRIAATEAGIWYGISRGRGFLVSTDRGATWSERNEGLPVRRVYPFRDNRVRFLTSLGVDPLHPERVAVTTVDEIYLSGDFGRSWQKIGIGKPLRTTSYLTSVALSPASADGLLVGTSFNGFFETTDRGRTWTDPSLTARFLYRGAGFYEEIAAIAYHPEDPRVLYFSCGFGKGVYRSDPERRQWTRLAWIGEREGEIVRGLRFTRFADETTRSADETTRPADVNTAAEETTRPADSWVLEARTATAVWRYEDAQTRWKLVEVPPPRPPEVDPASPRGQRLSRAAGRTGIYLSSFHVSGAELDRHLAFLQEHGMDSMVVDFKEDNGIVTYDTRLELPRRLGAVSRRINLEELLRKAHENGIYVIGRVLVFKDRAMYNYDGYRHAVWDRPSGAPWRHLINSTAAETGETIQVQREYWVDPFSSFVWEYNVAIARELQERGVDEIQFDYIRFPSDGPLSRIQYRHQADGMTKIDALESFLTMAREALDIPISTDLYGFNSWHRMGTWIGQCIEVLSDYVDVISPMYYPSHFPRDFIREQEYLERARTIYREGVIRSASIVEGRSLIRPYIQAFLIGEELRMEAPEYSAYLIRQLEGANAAGSSGFTLWNASNRYYMVRQNLKPYTLPPPPSDRS